MWPSDTPMMYLLRYDHVVPVECQFFAPSGLVEREVRTPHLPLLLEVGVYDAEGGFSPSLVVVDLDEVVDVEVEFSCF